jgi:hypothetical protein
MRIASLLFSAALLLHPFAALAALDSDGDGLEDTEEITRGTDPQNADTDGGGEADGAEIANGRDPNVQEDDLTFDRDNDTLTNGEEEAMGTDPSSADTDEDGTNDADDRYPLDREYSRDEDEDGMPDEYEEKYNFSPTLRADAEEDTDGDGLKNIDEFIYGTDPMNTDTDNDGVIDGEEVEKGTEPLENPCLEFGSPKQPFADVSKHWAEGYAVRLQRVKVQPTGARLADGYAEGDVRLFAPDRAISRFELLKLALLSSCITVEDTQEPATVFTDVPLAVRPREPADRAERRRIIYSAMREGIVQGYEDGTFRPDAPVNRAEAVKILLAAARLKPLSDYDIPAPQFSDVPVDAWFRESIELAVGYDLLTGYPDGTFRPEQSITRAEAGKLVYLLMLINPHVNGYVLPADGLGLTDTAEEDMKHLEPTTEDSAE